MGSVQISLKKNQKNGNQNKWRRHNNKINAKYDNRPNKKNL